MVYTVFRKEGVPVKNIGEVSRMTGVSVRTLQFYDKIGLLHPDGCTEAGYRLYGAPALERLRQILLFREVDFSLKEIKDILARCYNDAMTLLKENRSLLDEIALYLLQKETITGGEMVAIIEGRDPALVESPYLSTQAAVPEEQAPVQAEEEIPSESPADAEESASPAEELYQEIPEEKPEDPPVF